MKLLFEQNLSPRLADLLDDIFPDSIHVSSAGLESALDEEVWIFAHDQQFAIVSKDSDFADLSVLRGQPPKIIWIRLGNCTTLDIENLLRSNQQTIEQFGADQDTALLTLDS